MARLVPGVHGRRDGRAPTGHRFAGLEAALDGLAQGLIRVGHQHHAFPILNAFHTRDRQTSLPVAVVVLDELITLLSEGVAVEARMPVQSVNAVRIGIHSIVSAAPGGPDGSAQSAAPPAPGRETLLDAGLPVVDETGYRARLAGRAAHRARLRAFLEGQGWAWSAVHPLAPAQ